MVGALTSAVVAGFLPERVIAALFALLLVYTAFTMARGLVRPAVRPAGEDQLDPSALDGPDAPAYRTRRLPAAVGVSFLAGNVSGCSAWAAASSPCRCCTS